MLTIHEKKPNICAISFCNEFLNNSPKKRYIFGRNEYAKSIANLIEIEAFIDDFTTDFIYLNKPIIKTENIPSDVLVVVATIVAQPLTVKKKLSKIGVKQLDYYAFYEYSGLNIMSPFDIMYPLGWDLFRRDFTENKAKYLWIYDLLSDNESKKAYSDIVNFRLSADLSYMQDFTYCPKQQYFENFLCLKEKGEVFIDAGSFDGFNTLEFINKCPDYEAIYIFEPNPENMKTIKARFAEHTRINFIQQGLYNKKQTVKFCLAGGSSVIHDDGSTKVKVDSLDQTVNGLITFIKMDIEGFEGLAIEGAKQTILRNHPKLAVCVYHKPDDFWKIPAQILSIRSDYKIYIRHYTEGFAETVMYFIPN